MENYGIWDRRLVESDAAFVGNTEKYALRRCSLCKKARPIFSMNESHYNACCAQENTYQSSASRI